MSNSLRPHRYSPWKCLGQNTGVGSLSLLQGTFPNPGIKPKSPALQSDSLPAEPQGKSKDTGVGSQSLLQWIFPTQEFNQGLLHCRWIFYQLSYQGSPAGVAKFPLFLKARFSHTNSWNGACPVVGFKTTCCKCWSM